MPLYEYKCINCKHTRVILQKEPKTDIQCDKCLDMMTRQITSHARTSRAWEVDESE